MPGGDVGIIRVPASLSEMGVAWCEESFGRVSENLDACRDGPIKVGTTFVLTRMNGIPP